MSRQRCESLGPGLLSGRNGTSELEALFRDWKDRVRYAANSLIALGKQFAELTSFLHVVMQPRGAERKHS